MAYENYWSFIKNTFDNPKDLWENCFKNQSNPQVRSLVLLTVFNGGEIEEEELKIAFQKFISLEKIENFSHVDKGFNSCAHIATKSFLNRSMNHLEAKFQLFNPSISDYILAEYKDDTRLLKNVFLSLSTLKSLEQLSTLIDKQIIQLQKGSVVEILTDSIMTQKPISYRISAALLTYPEKVFLSEVKKILHEAFQDPKKVTNLSCFFKLLEQNWDSEEVNQIDSIGEFLKNRVLSEEEILALLKFVKECQIDFSTFYDELNEAVADFLYFEVSQQANEEDWSSYLIYSEGHDGDLDIDFNQDGLWEELIKLGDKILTEIGYNAIPDLEMSIEEVLEPLNLSEIAEINYPECDYDYEDTGRTGHRIDDIDELFQRD